MANYFDISVAVAGACQAGSLVQKFAHHDMTFDESEILRHSLKSLFVMQPDSTLGVFDDDLSHLKLGIETGFAQFGGGKGNLDTEISRYWIGMLALSRKLLENPEAKPLLAQRLQQIERQLSLCENDVLNEQIIANLASIYREVISPLGNKIQVTGSQQHLARTDVQNRIRATLLAGVRAGVLWQQVGGKRWQFLFARKKILNQMQSFYQTL
ncbi:High frequency lysogenization protein HflD [Phocoenobacter uteri]|uniref:High frequency lysogenization protein HflD homolog n=1 Tax=Phocoenobacter uteri TaxID=146806 RepID=A0A379CAF8_9PAST|nr:high frequency lysogenization protein HflD [Phocoenobacter uteri]MDG6881249.1 lysogenization protein HflD [Phocoenobacter uteri]SUB59273.1 High frequency lysogenization protein HflD [Phocoenobacter uteri]